MVSKTSETFALPLLRRVVIENVQPEIEAGRFPIKRVTGERVEVTADIHADGHDVLFAVLQYRSPSGTDWQEVAMQPLVNDRWKAEFGVSEQGRYFYTVCAWVDPFKSWRRDLRKKINAGQDVGLDLLVGVGLIEDATARARGNDREQLLLRASELKEKREKGQQLAVQSVDDQLTVLMQRYADRRRATTYERELAVVVDRVKARFSTWYELFPRSCADEPGKHGTFRDCEKKLPYIADMGFDVLYFPPIHPIGRVNRKGKNNTEQAAPDDVGSPWAIGAEEGGHRRHPPATGYDRGLQEPASESQGFWIGARTGPGFPVHARPSLREGA